MNGSCDVDGNRSCARRPTARLRTLVLLVAGVLTGSAWGCSRGDLPQPARELHLTACEPYARAAWLPPAASGHLGGMRVALGFARLHRRVQHVTGHDAGASAVVPVLTMRTAPGMHVVLMPTLRGGDVGASVVVSLRIGA